MRDFRLRVATESDLKTAKDIADKGRAIMNKRDNPQWDTGYPWEDLLLEDIKLNRLYFAYDNCSPSDILGMAVFQKEKDPDYEGECFWAFNEPYICIHRLVSLQKGIGKFIISEGIALAKRESKCVRIDTHPKNIHMQRLISSFDFHLRGSFYQEGYIDGAYALAYELK